MRDQLPRPEPRDAFKRALRAQLMAQAPAALARRESAWSRFQRSWASWLRPAAAVAAVLVVLVAGAGRAAADSLPGDAAFGLKTAAEELQLAFALDDTTRLQLLAEGADHRLAELSRAVTSRPDAVPTTTDAYAAAVARFTAAVDALRASPGTSADMRTAAEDVVDAAHDKHEAVLDELEKTAPAEAQDGLDRAKQEAEKLHATVRPDRTPDREGPDGSRSLEPARTTEPARATPTRTASPRVSPRP